MRTRRWYVTRFILVISVAILCWQLARLADPAITPADDFISYWAAARLNATGQNPYDPALVLPLQRTLHRTKDTAYRIWYPPWALPILMPFALLPYTAGRFLWFVLTAAALLLSADYLWTYYGGRQKGRGVAWVIGATFVPAILCWRTGQIGVLILLGIVGFLYCEKEHRCVAAGVSLALAAIKPPLLYLFWIALLLWIIDTRRWRILLGGTIAGLTLLAAAIIPNPALPGEFLRMALTDQPSQPVSTIGTVLRMLSLGVSGHDRYWLQFVPSVGGVIWLAIYWRRHRQEWRWERRMPTVLLASIATASWAWVYDDVVLLVAVMPIAVAVGQGEGSHSGVLGAYLAINAAMFVINVANVDAFWYVWTPAALAIWYAKAHTALGTRPAT